MKAIVNHASFTIADAVSALVSVLRGLFARARKEKINGDIPSRTLYMFLACHATIAEGDQYFSNFFGTWEDAEAEGASVEFDQLYRRPVKGQNGVGVIFLRSGDVVQKGDLFLDTDEPEKGWRPLKEVGQALIGGNDECIYIRPMVRFNPAETPKASDIGEGYRQVVYGERLEEGDECQSCIDVGWNATSQAGEFYGVANPYGIYRRLVKASKHAEKAQPVVEDTTPKFTGSIGRISMPSSGVKVGDQFRCIKSAKLTEGKSADAHVEKGEVYTVTEVEAGTHLCIDTSFPGRIFGWYFELNSEFWQHFEKVEQSTTPAVRKFRHKDGFVDGTDYVEVSEKGVTLVDVGGNRCPSLRITLATCLDFVKEGAWVELTVAPEPSIDDLKKRIEKLEETVAAREETIAKQAEEIDLKVSALADLKQQVKDLDKELDDTIEEQLKAEKEAEEENEKEFDRLEARIEELIEERDGLQKRLDTAKGDTTHVLVAKSRNGQGTKWVLPIHYSLPWSVGEEVQEYGPNGAMIRCRVTSKRDAYGRIICEQV